MTPNQTDAWQWMAKHYPNETRAALAPLIDYLRENGPRIIALAESIGVASIPSPRRGDPDPTPRTRW